MRVLYLMLTAIGIALFWAASAEATKPTYNCANIRCASGNCVDTPGGPICQTQTLSCANVLCQQGNQCVESSTGPQCVPNVTYPVQPVQPPTPPAWQYPQYQQSCAYGGYYYHGQLICNPPPAWRNPYQNGWGYYAQPPRYVPPYYQPRPRPRVPWHPWGSDNVQPDPNPGGGTICTMEYDPVCAEKPVLCVRAPCPPVRKTFGNSCKANAEEYTVLYKGQCR